MFSLSRHICVYDEDWRCGNPPCWQTPAQTEKERWWSLERERGFGPQPSGAMVRSQHTPECCHQWCHKAFSLCVCVWVCVHTAVIGLFPLDSPRAAFKKHITTQEHTQRGVVLYSGSCKWAQTQSGFQYTEQKKNNKKTEDLQPQKKGEETLKH